jgi:hypothetical protein
MRNRSIYTIIGFGLIFFLFIISSSCNRKLTISYPNSINFGENILAIPDGKIKSGESYSFESNITKKCDLVVRLTNLSKAPSDPAIPTPTWKFSDMTGWTAGNYVNGVQEFHTVKPGTSDFKIVFQGTDGECTMEFFENSSVVTRVRHFTW